MTGCPMGCPFIAVSHGFYYNADIFADNGVEVPETWDELLAAAETLDDAGITPFANASGDEWTMAEMLFMNFAPSFIGGSEGRLAYESGERCLDDEQHRQRVPGDGRHRPLPARWAGGVDVRRQPAALAAGEAAMWIGGSWDIPYFEGEEPDIRVERVPGADARRAAPRRSPSTSTPASASTPASETRMPRKTVIEWLASDEAAATWPPSCPASSRCWRNHRPSTIPMRPKFISWNADSDLDVRFSWPVLSDGTPDAYTLDPVGRRRRGQRQHHAGGGGGRSCRPGSPSGTSPPRVYGLSAHRGRRGTGTATGGCSSPRRWSFYVGFMAFPLMNSIALSFYTGPV